MRLDGMTIAPGYGGSRRRVRRGGGHNGGRVGLGRSRKVLGSGRPEKYYTKGGSRRGRGGSRRVRRVRRGGRCWSGDPTCGI